MIGSVIGIVCGFSVYLSISRLSLSITQRGRISVPYLLLATLIPVVSLLFLAFLLEHELVFAGIGAAGTLVVTAIIKFVIHCFSEKS